MNAEYTQIPQVICTRYLRWVESIMADMAKGDLEDAAYTLNRMGQDIQRRINKDTVLLEVKK